MKPINKKFTEFVFDLVIPIIFGTIISGCTVGPDYTRPQTIAENAKGYINADKSLQDANIAPETGRWWERFADQATIDLVQEALNNNNNLHAAAARGLQAEAIFSEARRKQLPDISYNFARSRSKTSFNFGGAGRFNNISTTFSQGMSISYILDLFGKLKHSERAAWADLLATQANQHAVIHAVISNVVKARANIATIQRQLAISHANIKNWQRNLEIIERRYRRGLVSSLDVRLARENLEASNSSEIVVELLLARARNALDVLLGRQPASSKDIPHTLAELPDLSPIPVGIPASLLDRRPDIRAAELALKASNERIGVSIAELYPDLTLTGSLGRSADRFGDIFKHETEIYSTVLRITQPIFKGGQLRARVDAAKAKNQELAANYSQAVLVALREVEDALIKEQLLQRRLKSLRRRFNEAMAAEKLATDRYTRGVERLITVLETERRRRIAENELNIIKGELWTGRVDLFLALGGDWAVDPENTNN